MERIDGGCIVLGNHQLSIADLMLKHLVIEAFHNM